MGKKKVTWTGKDPDNDALQYRAYLSSNNGATWQALGVGPSKDAEVQTPTAAETRPESGAKSNVGPLAV